MQLTIDRKIWDRGNGSYPSCMLNDNGTYDCMGFLGKACGLTDDQLKNVTTPMWIPLSWCPGILVRSSNDAVDNSELCSKLIRTNDNKKTSDLEKEAEFTKLFTLLDVNVQFVN